MARILLEVSGIAKVELLDRFRKADGLLEANMRFAHPAHIVCCPAFYEWHGFGLGAKVI